MNTIVFTQFKDDLPVDVNKKYYISPFTQDTGLQEIHKLCLFPEKLREYLVKLEDNPRHQLNIEICINATTTLKWTPLIIASRNGVNESVKLLLEYRADINFQTEYGWTALMLACTYCNTDSNIESVKLLLKHSSININFQPKDGWTSLMLACKNCNTYSSIECVKLLLEYKPNINLQTKYENTALMLACIYYNTTSSIQCVKLLLEYYELTSQELNLKPLIKKGLLIKELYPVFLPYLLKITDTNTLKLLPVDLLVELNKIRINIINQSNNLKEFDLNSIILYEMKKCL